MSYAIRLEKDETGLGPMFEGCQNLFLEWFNKERILFPMGDLDPFPISIDDAKRYVESHKKDTWMVFAKSDNEWVPVGYAGLFVRQRHKVGIIRYAICDDRFFKKGHAARACGLLVKWAFDECGLNLLTASTSSSNQQSGKVLLKNDFVECGRYTKARYENGSYYDEHHFELSREKFYSK